MKTLLATFAMVAVLTVTLMNTGCDRAQAAPGSLNPPNGKSCTVQFRRDALGTAANLPVPPMSSAINDAATSVTGVLKLTTEEWVVLDRDGKEVWIPKGVILLIAFQ